MINFAKLFSIFQFGIIAFFSFMFWFGERLSSREAISTVFVSALVMFSLFLLASIAGDAKEMANAKKLQRVD